MKFDTIIIGGGLAGLICGIRLQKAGKKCAIVSAGQSAMHFSSGSFELLGRLPDGTETDNPLEAMKQLPKDHPYSILGADTVAEYAAQVPQFLEECGIKVSGTADKNTWRISPTGERKHAWLTLEEFASLPEKDTKIGNKALIVNILGYLDFNTKFLADSFEKQGTECRIVSVKLEEMERLRKNPSEMRSTNIARVMDRDDVWSKAVEQIKSMLKDEDTVVMPAVFGLKDSEITEKIRTRLGVKTYFIATMPPSVPGIRSQMRLKAEFEKCGGYFFLGDTVKGADYNEDGSIRSIETTNFGNIRMYADNFVLASGSFFSKGLTATPFGIIEPIFGIDVKAEDNRDNWFDRYFWNKQNYISFGAVTKNGLHASKDGKTIWNLFLAGSIIGGYNALYEGCGGGIAIITALYAADEILKK